MKLRASSIGPVDNLSEIFLRFAADEKPEQPDQMAERPKREQGPVEKQRREMGGEHREYLVGTVAGEEVG